MTYIVVYGITSCSALDFLDPIFAPFETSEENSDDKKGTMITAKVTAWLADEKFVVTESLYKKDARCD